MERRTSLHLPEIELGILGCAAGYLVTMMTELSRTSNSGFYGGSVLIWIVFLCDRTVWM
jgi:hypothetical protein